MLQDNPITLLYPQVLTNNLVGTHRSGNITAHMRSQRNSEKSIANCFICKCTTFSEIIMEN